MGKTIRIFKSEKEYEDSMNNNDFFGKAIVLWNLNTVVRQTILNDGYRILESHFGSVGYNK